MRKLGLGGFALILGLGHSAFAQQLVQTSPAPLACFARSGTIAVGGVAQVAMQLNLLRRVLIIQNPGSAAARITFTTSGTASTSSLELLPGASFVFPPSGIPTAPLSVWAATTGQVWAAEECW